MTLQEFMKEVDWSRMEVHCDKLRDDKFNCPIAQVACGPSYDAARLGVEKLKLSDHDTWLIIDAADNRLRSGSIEKLRIQMLNYMIRDKA